MSTNKPMFGPVVLEIACDISIKTIKIPLGIIVTAYSALKIVELVHCKRDLPN